MLSMILIFSLLVGVFWISIPLLRNLTGSEKWQLTKTIVYAIICSALALAVLICLVILF